MVDIIEVKGRIDPIVADFVEASIERAAASGSEVLVVQIDSPGSLLDRSDLDVLLFRVAHSPVPIAVWVGPTGAKAYGGAAQLVQVAAVGGMAPATRIGHTRGFPGSVTPEAAVARGLVDVISPTLGEFLVSLDGREIDGVTLDTARTVTEGGATRLEAAGNVRFAKLDVLERLLHAAASPSVAYLLLMVGLSLIVFEFFSVGVGVAGATGALLLVLAGYGLAVLPTSPLGLALIAIGLFGFAVDIQAGAPRAWTAIGSTCLVVGSVLLFGQGIGIPWPTLAAVLAGVFLLMVSGMRSMLRARFSTPTIGREAMIGTMGQATTAVDPEGTVTLEGGLWRARTNRATPIEAGARVRVVSIDGLLLEVEPEEGGARDAGH
jgi:membrane-bound serine protease (ClpP class)